MSAPAATSPEQALADLMRALDALDTDSIEARFTDFPQGVDELSGGWRRGRAALHEYFEGIKAAGLSELHSELSDVHVSQWGNTALATFVLDQTYILGGASERVHAPTSVVMHREGGDWRVALFHSVPLEPAPA